MAVEDGRYTGAIDFYAYGENKAVALRELAEREGYDLEASYAYSDSVTDAPMLGAVGHAFVVNPDRTLRRLAAEHGWGALTFSKPVALRSHLAGSTPALAAAGVVALGVVAWVVWRALRRRRRD